MSRVTDFREGFSVGSRVSWGAILAGVVVAFAVYFLLNLLGTAVGLSVIDRTQPDNLSVGAGIWAVVSVMIALFLGGWVTSRFTVGEDRLEAVLNGAIVWGASFLLLLWVVSVGLGMGYSTMVAVSSPQVATSDQRVAVVSVSADTAARASWWAFAGTLLSMVASIGGSLVGTEATHAGARHAGERGRPIETTRTSPTG